MQEITTAQTLLRETGALQSLKVTHPERYRRLEMLLTKPRYVYYKTLYYAASYALRINLSLANYSTDSKELYSGTTKEKRRGTVWKGTYVICWNLLVPRSISLST